MAKFSKIQTLPFWPTGLVLLPVQSNISDIPGVQMYKKWPLGVNCWPDSLHCVGLWDHQSYQPPPNTYWMCQPTRHAGNWKTPHPPLITACSDLLTARTLMQQNQFIHFTPASSQATPVMTTSALCGNSLTPWCIWHHKVADSAGKSPPPPPHTWSYQWH